LVLQVFLKSTTFDSRLAVVIKQSDILDPPCGYRNDSQMVKNYPETSRRDRRVISPSFRKNGKLPTKSPKRTRSQQGGGRAHSPTTVGAVMDLSVIDRAFGEFADLYDDVLKVSHLSSQKEIQAAFFDRRSELFSVLSTLDSTTDEITLTQRMHAERRMDAIVIAFRILREPNMRREYDNTREKRMLEKAKVFGTPIPTTIKADPTKHRSLFYLGRSDSESPRSVTTDGFDSEPTISPPLTPTRRPGRQKNLRQQQLAVIKATPSDDGLLARTRKGGFAIPVSRRAKAQQRKKEAGRPPIDEPSSFAMTESSGGATSDDGESSLNDLVTIETNADSTVFSAGETTIVTSADYTITSDTMITEGLTPDDENRSLVLVTRSDDEHSFLSGGQNNRQAAKRDKGGAGILDKIRRHPMVAAITEEVEGSVQDTVSALDQVFNVFTLTDEDISAVCGRINKAQKLYRES